MIMKKILTTLLFSSIWFLTSYAQKGLNVTPFFSDTYKSNPSVTFVEVYGQNLEMAGLTKYISISITANASLSDSIEKAVKKDGATAKSKEVIYKKGTLYFGMYYLGGKGSERCYLYYLNQRPVGNDKTILIYMEGSITEEMAKSLIKK